MNSSKIVQMCRLDWISHAVECFYPSETDMFFLAVSMVGTDFTMICQLFPHRARSEIKVSKDSRGLPEHEAQYLSGTIKVSIFVFQNKFKKEERQNSWRIDKAFSEKKHISLQGLCDHLQSLSAASALVCRRETQAGH